MKQTITYQELGVVVYHKNPRNKNLRISVNVDNTVRVSVPFQMSWKTAEEWLFKHKKAILERQKQNHSRKEKIDFDTILTTYEHQIILKQSDKARLSQKGKEITLYLPKIDEDIIANIIVQVYKKEAEAILPQRVKILAQQFGFTYKQVKIRDNRSIWGSCSSNKVISLNAQLMKLPIHLIDYVILHELTHTEHQDHSQKFWNRLSQVTHSDAKVLSKEVNQYSTYPLILKKVKTN